jgi:hypothetical protein
MRLLLLLAILGSLSDQLGPVSLARLVDCWLICPSRTFGLTILHLSNL